MRGVLIHSLAYGDHSRIAHILLQEEGLKSFMIRIGKGSRNKNNHLLAPLSLIDVEAHLRENVQIHQVKQLSSNYTFTSIPFDPVKSAITLFCSELLHKTIHADYANAQLFKFIQDSIIQLDQSTSPANFAIQFLSGLCAQYGFEIQTSDSSPIYFDLSSGEISPEIPSLNSSLMRSENHILSSIVNDPEHFELITASQTERKNIIHVLIQYLKMHMDSRFEIKSLDVLHEVFSD